ncbi:reverse transcriptase [Phytophthora cinnamomi]|uniref:reverse transcriptase n=1 Tax=Phytophthora cinnamomi TaxID=4785 RepID=UPI00355A80F1|nr:reverse transcriptase [Phytophthora cinnamomi]
MSTEVPMESSNTPATHVARADCPHLSDPEWEALQRLSTVIGEAAIATMLRTLSPTEQHGVALGFIMKEQRDAASSVTASSGTTPRAQPLKLNVSNYVGREGEPLLRWLVELDTAIAARRIVDPLSKVAFAMSCLGGRARSWAYGRRLSDPTCFSTYEVFKEELKQVFEPPQNEFRSRAEFLDLQQGKHDVHAYAQRARYLVSNIVTNPIDEATKVVTFMKGLRDGPVKTYLFREYLSTLEAAITLAMQEEFSLRQAKLHVNVPRPQPRPVAGTGDSGASNNFVRLRSLSRLDFEEVDTPRSLLEVRLATGAIVKTEKRVVIVRFSYKQRVFVEHFIVLDLDDKFDVVMGMPWLARHDPVIDWKKRTLVRFGRDSGTESDGPVTAAHAPAGARGSPVETALYAAVPECPRSARGRAQVRPTSAMLPTSEEKDVLVPGTNTRVQVRMGQTLTRRGQVDDDPSTPGVDAPPVMRGYANNWRRAGLHDEGPCDQAGLDIARPQTESAGEQLSTAGPGSEEQLCGARLRTTRRRRKRKTLRKSRSGTETQQEQSPGQTAAVTPDVETLSVLTRTDTGFQYREMELASPPTTASELTSFPAMSWKRFTRDLHDGRIEQVCVLSDSERTESESEELTQLFMGSITESEDTLSAKTKRERFEEQGWDSLKSSPYYELLREYKDVLQEEIPAELPQDKGIQHEIDLVPGTKYCVTRQWPLPREQVKAIDDFFESRRKAGQVRESKSPHSAPMFCVKKPQGGWRIVP